MSLCSAPIMHDLTCASTTTVSLLAVAAPARGVVEQELDQQHDEPEPAGDEREERVEQKATHDESFR